MSREHYCPITLDEMEEPVVLIDCGHTFEKEALEEHIATQQRSRADSQPTCPTCRCEIENGFQTNYFAKDATESLKSLTSEVDRLVGVEAKVIKLFSDQLRSVNRGQDQRRPNTNYSGLTFAALEDIILESGYRDAKFEKAIRYAYGDQVAQDLDQAWQLLSDIIISLDTDIRKYTQSPEKNTKLLRSRNNLLKQSLYELALVKLRINAELDPSQIEKIDNNIQEAKSYFKIAVKLNHYPSLERMGDLCINFSEKTAWYIAAIRNQHIDSSSITRIRAKLPAWDTDVHKALLHMGRYLANNISQYPCELASPKRHLNAAVSKDSMTVYKFSEYCYKQDLISKQEFSEVLHEILKQDIDDCEYLYNNVNFWLAKLEYDNPEQEFNYSILPGFDEEKCNHFLKLRSTAHLLRLNAEKRVLAEKIRDKFNSLKSRIQFFLESNSACLEHGGFDNAYINTAMGILRSINSRLGSYANEFLQDCNCLSLNNIHDLKRSIRALSNQHYILRTQRPWYKFAKIPSYNLLDWNQSVETEFTKILSELTRIIDKYPYAIKLDKVIEPTDENQRLQPMGFKIPYTAIIRDLEIVTETHFASRNRSLVTAVV